MKEILQTIPVVDEQSIIQSTDSLKYATQQFVETLKTDPRGAMDQVIDASVAFGLKVLAAILIYIVGLWLIKRIKSLMQRNFEKKNTDKTIASFANSLVSVCLTGLIIILCISTLGINTTSLAALLAAGGMAIGMALSGTLQNFAGGLMMLFFKPFKVGDYIEAAGYSGTVSEVNMVSTKLTTVDNRVIIIPNGALSSGNINNYSIMDTRRVDFLLPMAHGTDSESFIACIKDLIKEETRAFDSFVALNVVDMDKVEFVVKLWVKSADYWDVYHQFYEKMYKEFALKGFNFAAHRFKND